MKPHRSLLLPLVLTLAACGASITSSGPSPSDDASDAHQLAPDASDGDAAALGEEHQARALVVPGSELPATVRALLLRGPSPMRPGVYVFGELGAPDDAPGYQLRVVDLEAARALGEGSVFAPSITDARRWERTELR